MKKYFCIGFILVFIQMFCFSSSFAQYLIGDVNNDGVVNSTDAAIMKRYLLGIIDTFPVEDEMLTADTNGDGVIDSTDYVLLRRYILGIIDKFPKDVALPTPEPINTGAYPDWDKTYSSYATFTGSGYTGGSALLDPIPPDMEITALNPYDYNGFEVQAALAGAYLEVTGEKGSTIVYVNDLYPEGGPGALDLCPISFDKIGDMAAGIIDIEWRIVAAPITGNVSYRIKEGSSPSWLAVQVRNHKYPVLKMEMNQNGQWIEMEKMFWNHFLIENVISTTPQIRITDIRGYVLTDIIDSIPEFDRANSEAYIVPGNVQFPD
ncbi:UNVERIFIED_CONTAM: expansin (peptidoglycan-binding protein) [Acetivibrio alkalicellulosi]